MIAFEVLESRYWVRSIFCLRQRSEPRNGDVSPVAVPLPTYAPRGSGFAPLRDDCLPRAMHGGYRRAVRGGGGQKIEMLNVTIGIK